jgi:AcrR family transcriptional regulator
VIGAGSCVASTTDGFLEARTVDIAAAADVAIGTFSLYVDSNAEIFRAVIEQLTLPVANALGLTQPD